eukprot:COSAG04_NODE_298_length_17490_cov_10.214249_7_plen_122_part_00
MSGNAARTKTYRLREVPASNKEGDFFRMVWDGVIPEWNMLGFSYELNELPPNPHGAEGTMLGVNFHVGRKYLYYWWPHRIFVSRKSHNLCTKEKRMNACVQVQSACAPVPAGRSLAHCCLS